MAFFLTLSCWEMVCWESCPRLRSSLPPTLLYYNVRMVQKSLYNSSHEGVSLKIASKRCIFYVCKLCVFISGTWSCIAGSVVAYSGPLYFPYQISNRSASVFSACHSDKSSCLYHLISSRNKLSLLLLLCFNSPNNSGSILSFMTAEWWSHVPKGNNPIHSMHKCSLCAFKYSKDREKSCCAEDTSLGSLSQEIFVHLFLHSTWYFWVEKIMINHGHSCFCASLVSGQLILNVSYVSSETPSVLMNPCLDASTADAGRLLPSWAVITNTFDLLTAL